jgi:hypothetical protein
MDIDAIADNKESLLGSSGRFNQGWGMLNDYSKTTYEYKRHHDQPG